MPRRLWSSACSGGKYGIHSEATAAVAAAGPGDDRNGTDDSQHHVQHQPQVWGLDSSMESGATRLAGRNGGWDAVRAMAVGTGLKWLWTSEAETSTSKWESPAQDAREVSQPSSQESGRALRSLKASSKLTSSLEWVQPLLHSVSRDSC